MRPGVLFVLVLALFGLAGCGGDSGEPLTEAEYRAAGNDLCVAWSGDIASISMPDNPTDDDLIEFSAEAGRLADDYTDRLLGLVPPDSLAQDRAELEAAFDEYDALIETVPQTEAEVDAITAAGDAITTRLANIWSGCRNR